MLNDNGISSIRSIPVAGTAKAERAILMQIDLITQFNLNSTIINRRLDVTIITYCFVGLIIGTIATNLQSFIEFLGNRRSTTIITDKLQAVIHRCHFVVTFGILINNTAGFFFSIDGNVLLGIQRFNTIIRMDINGSAIFPFRTSQADMAYTILAGDGNSIFAVFPGNTNFAVHAVFANSQLVVQLDVVSQLAVGALHGCNVKIIRFSAGIVAIGLITGSRNGGIRLVINCNSRMGAGYRFQLGHVHRIGVERACRHVRNLAGNGLFSTHITNRYCTCRRRPGAVGRIYGGRFQIGCLFHVVHFISCGPGGGRPIAQGHTAIYIGTGGSTQSGCIGSRSSGVVAESDSLGTIKSCGTGRRRIRLIDAGQCAEADGYAKALVHFRTAADGNRGSF